MMPRYKTPKYEFWHRRYRGIREIDGVWVERPARNRTIQDVVRLWTQVIAWRDERQKAMSAIIDEIVSSGKPDTNHKEWLAHAKRAERDVVDDHEDDDEQPKKKKRLDTHMCYKIRYEENHDSHWYSHDRVITPIKPFRLELGQRLYDLDRIGTKRVAIVRNALKDYLTEYVRSQYEVKNKYGEEYVSLEIGGWQFLMEIQISIYKGGYHEITWKSDRPLTAITL